MRMSTTAGEGAAWTGEVLRQIREARGLTLPQLSERTKVTRHHLENLEADRIHEHEPLDQRRR